MTAGLAAATAAVAVPGLFGRRLRVDGGVFVVAHGALLWCAFLYADLPAAALLLAAAPLTAGRRTRAAGAA